MNPRRSARQIRDPKQLTGLLRRMEQAIAEIRSMARTLARRLDGWQEWDVPFTEAWCEVLAQAGRAVHDAEPDAVRAVSRRLDELSAELVPGDRAAEAWPVQGAWITNLRNVLDAMEDVARANPLSQPPLPLQFRRRQIADQA